LRGELEEWKNDALCKDCICFRNPIDEAKSIINGDINEIPSSSTCRSKRFYKGVITGVFIMMLVLVGFFLYVLYKYILESEG